MIVSRKDNYKGFLRVEELGVQTRSGKVVKREVMQRPNAVAALVYDTNKKMFILTSQFRPGPGTDMIEIVAGTLDKPGEDQRSAIAREIEEEIGYGVDTCKLIDEFYVSPGGNTEMVTVFYCEVSAKISEGGGAVEEDEEIDIIEMTKNELMSSKFNDAKTIIAVNWLRTK